MPSIQSSSLASMRPSAPTYNSWDSIEPQYRLRAIAAQIGQSEQESADHFDAANVLEGGLMQSPEPPGVPDVPRHASTATIAPSVVPSVVPSPHRLGWRSYLQIWAALVATTTLCIAITNIYKRLHDHTPNS